MTLEFSKETLFRYQIISEVLARIESGERQVDALATVAGRLHDFVYYSRPRQVSTRTLYRWLSKYREAGFQGLEVETRSHDPSTSKALPEELLVFFQIEKREDPRASIPELIRRAREHGIVDRDFPIDRTTVYRALKRRGVTVAYRRRRKLRDKRRFAFPHRMDMVVADGKHFRAGINRARRVALIFIDDATRFVLHVVVGTSENAKLFLRGLAELVEKHGFMERLYLDRGPGFIALETIAVMRRLDRKLIHGAVAYPEGRGKGERVNRTILADLLRGFDGRLELDPAPHALELRLQHYADTQYNHRPHEALKKRSPWECFSSDPKALTFPESRESLHEKFEIFLSRRVSPDNVVSIDSLAYEMPRGHDSQRVLLRRRLLDPGGLFFLDKDRLIELHPVDLAANARGRRASSTRDDDEQTQRPLPLSAAELAFERDFGPVVGADGGFNDQTPQDTEENDS